MKFFWGDRSSSFDPQIIQGACPLGHEPFGRTAQAIGCDELVFLHQVHGTQGTVITSREQAHKMPAFTVDGDFLATNVPGIGLGVATADCLPIIFYDEKKRVIAIAHAGWQGTVACITHRVLDVMREQFNCQMHGLRILFGPCAHVCCYEVGPEFKQHVAHFSFCDQLFVHKNARLFFNLPLCNRLLLQQYGIAPDQIDEQNSLCTIENENFCSVRRMKGTVLRQMNIAVLDK